MREATPRQHPHITCRNENTHQDIRTALTPLIPLTQSLPTFCWFSSFPLISLPGTVFCWESIPSADTVVRNILQSVAHETDCNTSQRHGISPSSAVPPTLDGSCKIPWQSDKTDSIPLVCSRTGALRLTYTTAIFPDLHCLVGGGVWEGVSGMVKTLWW